jgi:hypothetical protein
MIRLDTFWFLSDYECEDDGGPKEQGTYDQCGTGLLGLAYFLFASSRLAVMNARTHGRYPLIQPAETTHSCLPYLLNTPSN